MSVNTTENVKSYACDGSTTDFDFPFKITGTDTSVLVVTIWEDATSTPTVLAEESGNYSYSVSAPNNNYENGGTISTKVIDGASYVAYAWAAGYTITIERVVPYTQPSEFTAGGLNPKALEQTFDHQEFQIQQLDKRKSIHGPPSDPTGLSYEIPMVSASANKVLGRDASGNIIAVANVPTSGVSATAFGESLLDDADAAAARATLGMGPSDTVSFGDIITKGPWIDVRAYAASGSGAEGDPWVDALRNAYAANGPYHLYYMPAGHYKDASTIDLDGDGFIMIQGDGQGVTFIHYAVADTTSCMKIHNSGSICYDVQVRDISFDGDDTCTGAALELEDISIGIFENIGIDYFKGAATAKGIWLKGRDRMSFDNIHMSGSAIAVHVDVNPNNAIHLDHTSFSNMSFLGYDSDYAYGFKFDAKQFYNITIADNINFAKCKYGIYFSPTTPADFVYNWSIRDLRFEQGDTTNKDCWAIYLNADSTKPMRGVFIENVFFGSTYNGLYLRYGQSVTVIGSNFAQSTGYTQYDLGANIESVALINCSYAEGGTQTVAASTIRSMRQIIASGVGHIGFELFDKTARTWTGRGPTLLSTTNVPLNADGDTPIYTVPTGNRCILSYAILVAGDDAGATSTLSIGQNGAETDFIPANTLSNLDAQYDSVTLQPIPNNTPLKNKSYASGAVIEAQVANQSGGATNKLYLFGTLY